MKNIIKSFVNVQKTRKKQLDELVKQSKKNNKLMGDIQRKMNNSEDELILKDGIKFSIITAVYNGEKYIDDYILSIIKQNYNLNNIEIIFVDDGSTDKTLEKIKFYQSKYPEFIKFINQENQGQSIARNNGMKLAKNKWITFIDIDDFVSDNYFLENAIELSKRNPTQLLHNKWVSFIESENTFVNNHPLNWRFNNVNKKVNLNKAPKYFYLSASSSFFNLDIIKLKDIEFRENVKPNFEDAFFINEYITKAKINDVTFMGKTEYYYRKRSSNDSTINLSIKDKNRYTTLLEDGYLRLLELNSAEFIQKLVIYDLYWNVDAFEQLALGITDDELKTRNKNIYKIINHLEVETIRDLKGITPNSFTQLLLEIKGEESGVMVSYNYETKDNYRLKIEGMAEKIEQITVGEKSIKLFEYKEKKIILFDKYEYIERIYLIPKPIDINKEICFENETLKVEMQNKKKTHPKLTKNSKLLFIDKIDRADDNAEVLYKWVKANTQYKNVKFSVQKNTKSWERLKSEGVDLIEYGSLEFDKYYEEVDFIFCSDATETVENYKRMRYNWFKSNAKFIFLQHGVTTDNLQSWLFGKRIDGIVTTTPEETKIVDNTLSIFKEDIFETGFPRFDRLRTTNQSTNQILVAFTWRQELNNISEDTIEKSNYFQRLKRIVKDPILEKKCAEKEIIIKLILHPNMEKYSKLFKQLAGDRIIIKTPSQIKYYEEFIKSQMLITDYSSVWADMAICNKPIVFFQPDQKEFYENHTYSKMLAYEELNVGNVHKDITSLMNEVNEIVENDFKNSSSSDFGRLLKENNSISENLWSKIEERFCN